MAKKPDVPLPVAAPNPERGIREGAAPAGPAPVEIIPSVQGGISALASAHAPFLYFENAPSFGHHNGIIRVTLTASRVMPILGAPVPGEDHVVVAHLRMSRPAALALKEALESALLMAAPAKTEAKN